MEIVIQIVMLFILINCLLKLSFWKLWQVVIFGAICAAFIIGSCQFAILQSKTQLANYLAHIDIRQDMAVLITVESVLHFAFCFAMMKEVFGQKRNRWWLLPLYWYPSLLLFPVFFYLLTQLIFALPGTDFNTISYGLAAGVFVTLPLLSRLVRYFYPEEELRLEVFFLVSLLVCVLALITTVNGNVVYAAAEEAINWKALGLSLALFAFFFMAGLIWGKLKWMLRQRKERRNAAQSVHHTR